MSKTMWTPGPWLATRPSDDRHRMVAVMAPEATDRRGEKGVRVAACHIDHVPWDVCEANARLISAAPELYEMLEAVLDRVDFERGFDERSKASGLLIRARAALAKARGEP